MLAVDLLYIFVITYLPKNTCALLNLTFVFQLPSLFLIYTIVFAILPGILLLKPLLSIIGPNPDHQALNWWQRWDTS